MRTKTNNQLLIEKFCKEPINWPREVKILNSLLKREPLEFWQFFVLGFKLNSLAWLNTKEGQDEISKAKKLFKALEVKVPEPFVENHEYERETEPVRTLKDRLFS